ncbi:MAG: hypothetical protein IT318_26510 [Anaerolineales bacterium]|nr:hypothetical protein [Anaerolineales bacterium]
MQLNLDIVQVVSWAFGLVFPLWPFVLLSGVFQWRGRLLGIVNLSIFVWVLLLLMRAFVAVYSAPMLQILIPEPASTLLFVLTGVILIILRVSVPYWAGPTVQPSPHRSTRSASKQMRTAELPRTAHPNIVILEQRMDDALVRGDYAGVLHASSNIYETLAKDVTGSPSVNDKTLRQFFDKYRAKSSLPEPVLDYMLEVYRRRNVTPLAGHGSIDPPNISKRDAVTLAEMTKAFVRTEYRMQE